MIYPSKVRDYCIAAAMIVLVLSCCAVVYFTRAVRDDNAEARRRVEVLYRETLETIDREGAK